MIEPFCSEYIKSYRQHDREPEVEKTKPCLYYKDLGGNFLPLEDSKKPLPSSLHSAIGLNLDLDGLHLDYLLLEIKGQTTSRFHLGKASSLREQRLTIYNPERDETVIKELHLKNLTTTYQTSYCAVVGKKSLVIDPNDLEADQFMVYFNKYYGQRTQPVLRPLDTSRKINGYTRFSYYYTGKSHFEVTISKEGYDYFKRDYDLGKSRLFGKKQQALKKLKESKEAEENPKKEEDKREAKEIREGEEKKEKQEEKNLNKKKNEPEKKSDKSDEDEERDSSKKEKLCFFCCENLKKFSSPSTENLIEGEKKPN